MSYTDNLDAYHSFPETTSCYLDGRYFNLVFRNYPGLIIEPLRINIYRENGREEYDVDMGNADVDNRFPNLLRVVINTPEGRHSNLLILDFKRGIVFRYEPFARSYPYFDAVNMIVMRFLRKFGNFRLEIIDAPAHLRKNPACDSRGGMCVAYITKFAYDYLNGRQYDQSDILSFAGMVEQTYGTLPERGKDVEFGLFGSDNPNQGRNALIGTVGGAGIGALALGPPGLLLGGVTGGLIGASL